MSAYHCEASLSLSLVQNSGHNAHGNGVAAGPQEHRPRAFRPENSSTQTSLSSFTWKENTKIEYFKRPVIKISYLISNNVWLHVA